MSRPLPDNLIWLDLETTGSNEDVDTILEVGMVWTGRDLVERDSVSVIVKPEHMPDLNDVVREMHIRNGLLADVTINGIDIDAADRFCADWVRNRCGEAHALLCGSGVSHFDRRFIKKYMPLLDKRLTYYCIDTGQIRRPLELFEINIETNGAADADLKLHRGVDDARQHLAEAVAYRQAFRSAFIALYNESAPVAVAE